MGLLSNIRNALGYGDPMASTVIEPRTIARKLPAFPLQLVRRTVPVDKELVQIEADLRLVGRSYEGAIPTAATQDWLAWNSSGSMEVLNAWQRLTYLARDLERNSPYFRAFLRELQNNVLGHAGIRLQARVKNQKGGNLNKKLNENIVDAWKSSGKREIAMLPGNIPVFRPTS